MTWRAMLEDMEELVGAIDLLRGEAHGATKLPQVERAGTALEALTRGAADLLQVMWHQERGAAWGAQWRSSAQSGRAWCSAMSWTE